MQLRQASRSVPTTTLPAVMRREIVFRTRAGGLAVLTILWMRASRWAADPRSTSASWRALRLGRWSLAVHLDA